MHVLAQEPWASKGHHKLAFHLESELSETPPGLCGGAHRARNQRRPFPALLSWAADSWVGRLTQTLSLETLNPKPPLPLHH
jgi:hypothetical protein